jgi:hypothetical protein
VNLQNTEKSVLLCQSSSYQLSLSNSFYLRFEIPTVVPMKTSVFWEISGTVKIKTLVDKTHDSALAGGQWSASRPGRFILGERAPGTHWIGSCVYPRASLDGVKEKTFLTQRELELWHLSCPACS